MKKTAVIYNPASGRKTFKDKINRVVEKFSANGYRVELIPTFSAGDAQHKASQACDERVDLITAVGGDGTLNEVVSGMAAHSHRPLLGHIPAGTTNDFAATLNIPRDVEKAIDIILHGKRVAMDIGRINDDYFVYITAAGAFTKLTYTTPSHLKRIFGYGAYLFNFFKEVPYIFKPFRLKLSTEKTSIEGEYIIALIINARNFAGLRNIIRNVKLNDGLFDILLLPRSSVKVVTGTMRGMAVGIDEKLQDFGIIHLQGSNIRIESDKKLRWNIDGERGRRGDANIECLSKHIKICVPPRTKEKHF